MRTTLVGWVLFGALAAQLGCRPSAPEQRFYDQHIQPIFNNFCVGNTSPCHRIDDTTHTALGNLDLTSFESVQKRRDVLRTYGSYPHPLLLLKALPEDAVSIPYQQQFVLSEIRHAGGKPISPNSDAFYELKRWLDAGANRDGIAPAPSHRTGDGPCATAIPPSWQPPANALALQPLIDEFSQNVQPFIESFCAFSTCHSSPQADFYMTCGADANQTLFNFTQAADFVVTAAGVAIEQSELLLRPLDPQSGGVSHTGGVFFTSRTDAMWEQWKTWAEHVQMMNPLPPATKSAGQQFFEANVMPKLVQRGCALEGCHSPDGFNDFRLRSGAQGFFASHVLARNYHALADEFMAFDSVDVTQSRAVKKNISTDLSGGITHRAGSLLEDQGHAISDPCPSPFDPTATDLRAFCVLEEWHRIERQDRAADVSAMASGDVLPLAFVARPPNGDTLLQFDTYEGGADLKLADAVVGANGAITAVQNVRSALGPCAGLGGGADVDVRGPEWSYDATKLVFAARKGASSGLDLWLLDVAGGTCQQLTTDNGRVVSGSTVHVHNFDPVFAPDGSLVFASTRSGTLTLKNFLPNSDLFRVGPTLDFSNPEQMTFLLNSEIAPAFMQDGRVSFTAEKATADFYQLSGRRINWDLTDYHPLLAQRAQSTDTFDTTAFHPSVGYEQATEIREGLDRNFLIILSNAGAKGGGGALATFNRSIGPFEADRTEVTFVRSMVIVDAAATALDGTTGVYRSPFSLPNGEILASYAANVMHPTSDTPKYDLVAVDGSTGARRPLASDGTLSYVEAALGYKRGEKLLFTNLPQLVFGGHNSGPGGDTAIMHFPDASLLGTLLGANLRRGRNVAAFDGAAALKIYQEQPPPSASPGNLMGSQMVYTQRQVLGQASLESDHSIKVAVPARRPLILELVDGGGAPLFTMTEEHQVTPGEYITPGAPRPVFNNICGGCHGSITGDELDVSVSADALTGASLSISRDEAEKSLQ